MVVLLRTPLHIAASDGHLDACKLLVEAGASPHAKDRWGHTPFDDAAVRSHDAIVAFFNSALPKKASDGVSDTVSSVSHASGGLFSPAEASHSMSAGSHSRVDGSGSSRLHALKRPGLQGPSIRSLLAPSL